MVDENQIPCINLISDDWANTRCDKYDYMIAAFCGGAAGLIDSFFVGDPKNSILGSKTDQVADGFVKKAAQLFWKADRRTKGKSRNVPQTLEQCISYLEQAFPVQYDARYASDLIVELGQLKGMSPKNHHLLSISHSPDPIGLIFSIIDQFSGSASFVDHGELIHVLPKKTHGAIPHMQGSNLPSMLFCGFVNWIGHLISDLVGSPSTRIYGKTGRGAGIPMPFYGLFLKCDFGNIDGKTFSETMIKVFEEGYDVRFGLTLAIPVLMNELMIRTFWVIRQKFIRKRPLQESLSTSKHADFRIMLIVGNSTLCMVDGVDAAVRSNLNVVGFICHLNLAGWVRLTMLVLKELTIRFGPILKNIIDFFIAGMLEDISLRDDQQKILDFYSRMNAYDAQLSVIYNSFLMDVEKEYQELYLQMQATFDEKSTRSERATHSVKLAKTTGLSDEDIVHDLNELDDLFG